MGQSASDSFDFDLENDPDEYIVLKSKQYHSYKSEWKKSQKTKTDPEPEPVICDFIEIRDYEFDSIEYHFLGTTSIVNELYII